MYEHRLRGRGVDEVAIVPRAILEAPVGRLDEDIRGVAGRAQHALDAQHFVADGVAVAQRGEDLMNRRTCPGLRRIGHVSRSSAAGDARGPGVPDGRADAAGPRRAERWTCDPAPIDSVPSDRPLVDRPGPLSIGPRAIQRGAIRRRALRPRPAGCWTVGPWAIPARAIRPRAGTLNGAIGWPVRHRPRCRAEPGLRIRGDRARRIPGHRSGPVLGPGHRPPAGPAAACDGGG